MRGWKLDYLTQDRDRWWADVNRLMNLNFPQNVDFFISRRTAVFSRMTLIHENSWFCSYNLFCILFNFKW